MQLLIILHVSGDNKEVQYNEDIKKIEKDDKL